MNKYLADKDSRQTFINIGFLIFMGATVMKTFPIIGGLVVIAAIALIPYTIIGIHQDRTSKPEN